MLKLFLKVLEIMPAREMVGQKVSRDLLLLVMLILPRYALSDVVGWIKDMRSRYLTKNLNWLKKVYWK